MQLVGVGFMTSETSFESAFECPMACIAQHCASPSILYSQFCLCTPCDTSLRSPVATLMNERRRHGCTPQDAGVEFVAPLDRTVQVAKLQETPAWRQHSHTLHHLASISCVFSSVVFRFDSRIIFAYSDRNQLSCAHSAQLHDQHLFALLLLLLGEMSLCKLSTIQWTRPSTSVRSCAPSLSPHAQLWGS